MSISCDIDYLFNPLHSGLGNVLYNIATTYGIAKTHNLKPTIPSLKTFFKNWGEKYEKSILRNVCTDEYEKSGTTVYEIRKQRNIFINRKYQNGDKLMGYYQSYKYFDEMRNEIIDLFSIDESTKKYIDDKYFDIFNDKIINVSLHVRRSDFCTLGINMNETYYNFAINHMKQILNNECKFLIFSDDIEWCKKVFIGKEFIFIEGEDDYVDLYMMSFCDHNILANSTFSWWGAYLNKHEKKIVVYPKEWFNKNKRYRIIKNDYFPIEWIEL